MEKVTRKSAQKAMNDYVLNYYAEVEQEIYTNYSNFDMTGVKLRSCNAIVYETKNFFVLRSYKTIVAFIDKMTGQKFDVLRYVYGYTSTSCQHINKFFHDYGDFRVSTYTYREV